MIRVTLPCDSVWTALIWAKKYCPSYITCDTHLVNYNSHDLSKIDYFFDDEKDAVLFSLRWS